MGNNNQEYEEFLTTENNGSMSFKKLSELFKRSALRILVFVIIALVISTSVLLMIIAFNTEKQYQTKVTFNNKYIESGMSPWNATMDISNNIRSSSSVSDAMRKSGFTEEEITQNLDLVLGNLTVVAVAVPPVANEKVTTEVYAYAYRINLPKLDGVKWSKEKYTMLLDNITDNFVLNFKETYSVKAYSDSLGNFDSSKYNYMQSYDTLMASLIKMEGIINSLSNSTEQYRSTITGKTFNDIKAEAGALRSVLATFNSYMVSTGVSSGSSSGTELDFMKSKINTLTGQSKANKEALVSLQAALDTIKQTTSVNPDGTIVIHGVSSDAQMKIIDNYNKTLLELRSIDVERIKIGGEDGTKGDLAQYTTQNGLFEAKSEEVKTAERTKAVASINSIKENLAKVTEDLNKTIEDYNEQYLLKSFLKKTAPATEMTTKLVSTMTFLVVEVIVVLAAMTVALIVTSKKGKLNFKKSKEEKEEIAE